MPFNTLKDFTFKLGRVTLRKIVHATFHLIYLRCNVNTYYGDHLLHKKFKKSNILFYMEFPMLGLSVNATWGEHCDSGPQEVVVPLAIKKCSARALDRSWFWMLEDIYIMNQSCCSLDWQSNFPVQSFFIHLLVKFSHHVFLISCSLTSHLSNQSNSCFSLHFMSNSCCF